MAKKQRPAIRLPKSEAELIEKLRKWLGEEQVVKFLARLARVMKVEDGVYKVRSASTDSTYLVNLNERTCPCDGFAFRQRCAHFKLAYVKSLVEK